MALLDFFKNLRGKKASKSFPSKLKTHFLQILLVLGIISLLAACSGGGSGDGGGGGSDGGGTSTVTVSGTVYDSNGNTVQGATVSAFSTETSTTTDVNGQFTLQVSMGEHTLVIAKANSAGSAITETYELIDITAASTGRTYMVQSLVNSGSPVITRMANTAYTGAGVIASNAVDNESATLDLGAQASGFYDVGGVLKSSSLIYLYNYEVNSPLPFPLPPENTLNAGADEIYNMVRQAPSCVVSVSPARLQNLENATLDIPNPDSLPAATKILYFDYASHRWIDTTKTLADLPMTITRGGIYGIFQQTGNKVGYVNVTTAAPAGAIVRLGDQVYITSAANETFSFTNVHLPINNDSKLTAIVMDPFSSGNKTTEGTVAPVAVGAGNPASVEFDGTSTASTTPTNLTLTQSATSVTTGLSSSAVLITAWLEDEDQVPVAGVDITFGTNYGTLTATTATTGSAGTASVTFSAPTERTNRTATITATVSGLDAVNIPVQIIGTSITLGPDTLAIGSGSNDTLTISLTNGAQLPLYGETLAVSVSPPSVASVQLASGYSEFKTDNITGELQVVIIGNDTGNATITVTGLGATAQASLTVITSDITFSGVVYGTNGNAIANARVYAYSTGVETTTNSTGNYTLSVPAGSHTIMMEDPVSNYVQSIRVQTITGGETVNFVLQPMPDGVDSGIKAATLVSTLTSNSINGNTASLQLTASQDGNIFNIGDTNDSYARLSIILFDLARPLPFPLPSFTTRAAGIASIDVQAPSVVALVTPSRLKNLENARLNLPNPDALANTTRILHFSMTSHQWEDTGKTIADLPISITEGGLYGIFEETDGSVSRAWVSVNTAAGSMVMLGDHFYTTTRDNETFYLGDIFLPLNGGSLTMRVIDPSDSSVQTATMTPESGSAVTVQIGTGEIAIPDNLSIKVSKATVLTDDTDSATITATILDSSNTTIEGISVTFSADGGKLVYPNVVNTGSDGTAAVIFKSGPDKENSVVNITATVAGLDSASYAVQLTGTTIALAAGNTSLTVGGTDDTLTITVADAGGLPISGATLAVAISPANILNDSLATGYSGYVTDISGQLKLKIKGLQAGSSTVTVSGLGIQATTAYTVEADVPVFGIISPSEDINVNYNFTDGASVNIAFTDSNPDTITRDTGSFIDDLWEINDSIIIDGSISNDGVYTIAALTATTMTLAADDELTTEAPDEDRYITRGVKIQALAPDSTSLYFSTSLGTWANSGLRSIELPVPANDTVTAFLGATIAGFATVQVTDADNAGITDSVTIGFSAPQTKASIITLQSDVGILPASTVSVQYSTTLTARVTTNDGEPVGNATVNFSIETPSGGGEQVSPVRVLTDNEGYAYTTFTSGASTPADGVDIKADLIDLGPSATTNIIVGGGATSIVLTSGTAIKEDAEKLNYELPLSLRVADSAGLPVVGAVVTLKVWPTYILTACNDSMANEDIDRDGFLDANEDGLYDGIECSGSPDNPVAVDADEPYHCNGRLDPQNAAAGTLQGLTNGTLTTGANGTADFSLNYGKAYSRYVWVEIQATLKTINTYGATSTLDLPLYYKVGDEANLPANPFQCPVGYTPNFP